ncbi:MAG: hypothetical protein J5821_00590 [Alphaproteobacteria bacterium]|nr:hypothetical protein [Alphaproteobacteria bacterium]
MKKALIIANMLFASATAFGMMPNNPDGNSGENRKRNYVQFSGDAGESSRNVKPRNASAANDSSFNGTGSVLFDSMQTNLYKSMLTDFQKTVNWYRQMLTDSQEMVNWYQQQMSLNLQRTNQLIQQVSQAEQKISQKDQEIEMFRDVLLDQRSTIQEINEKNARAFLLLGGEFSNLTKLTINSSDLLNISFESLSFPALTELKVSGEVDWESVEDMTSKWGQLISSSSSTLQRISVSSSNIETLPSEIGSCKNLTYLDLHNSYKLQQLPDEIGNCKNLTYLDLHNAYIEYLPESIKNCKELRYLDIGNTDIWDIPKEIFELEKLEHLNLRNDSDGTDSITELSPEIGNLINLKWLALTGRFDLETLPPEIGNLRNLETLILEGNGLVSLPEEIGKLENLVYLDLSYGEFETLPPEIGNLRNLETLILEGNGLKSLPEEIWKLENLVCLDLRSTWLKTLPSEIVNLKKLEKLSISGNDKLKDIPAEVLNLFKRKLEATNESIWGPTMRYLLLYKNKTGLNDEKLREFVKEIQAEDQKLRERKRNLKSSIGEIEKYYSDSDSNSVESD